MDPTGAALTLHDALDRLKKRFDNDVVSPLLAAQHLKQATKTVREYFEAKMVLLKKLTLADNHIVDQLTDGANKELRNSLCRNKDFLPNQHTSPPPKEAISNAINHTAKISVPDEFIFFSVHVNKTRVSALMDTASTVNIINEGFARTAGCHFIRKKTSIQLAGNTECTSPGLAVFDLTFDKVTKRISALCLPDFQYSVLLGVNIRDHFPLDISLRDLSVSWPKDVQQPQSLAAKVEAINGQPVNSEIKKLLHEFVDVFDTKDEPVGKFAGEQFHIKLKSDKPIRRPPYKHP
ncbi:hypothetical protein B4U80_12154, partial [Leptotrombidium deliense]